MIRFATIEAMELEARGEEDSTANLRITTRPKTKWLRVVHKGGDEFDYFVDGKSGQQINRDFARSLIQQELRAQ